MNRPTLLPALPLLFAVACQGPPAAPTSADAVSATEATAAAPADEPAIAAIVARQQRVVEAFFGAPMPRPFALRVFAHKPAMLQFAQQQWHMPELPCWAVAMGTGTTLAVLAPSAWRAEACEHDPDDAVALERLLAHELVHVYHGQHRADVEFNDADDAAWFVEGLAVYASGQLDEQRVRQARELVAAGKAPARLADAWTGPARYAVAGTLARLVDQRLGRPRVVALMAASTTAELLAALGTTETQLLTDWRTGFAAAATAVPSGGR